MLWLTKLITVPLSCLTLGLWSLFLGLLFNTVVFYYVATLRWGWGFRSEGTFSQRLLAAALGALAVSVLNSIMTGLYSLTRREGRPQNRA